MSTARDTLTGALLDASDALQRACRAATEAGDTLLAHELRKSGWTVAAALARVARGAAELKRGAS